MKERPIPGDPATPTVEAMFAAGPEWVITVDGGTYDSFAAETMLRDGSNFQRVIAIEWRGQTNKTHEPATARVMMDPADAVGLAKTILHSAAWLTEYERRSG